MWRSRRNKKGSEEKGEKFENRKISEKSVRTIA